LPLHPITYVAVVSHASILISSSLLARDVLIYVFGDCSTTPPTCYKHYYNLILNMYYFYPIE
jgi:hypothetical protein